MYEADISNKDRTFVVWAHGIGRFGAHEECEVFVPAGEDADSACAEVCNDLISNLVESGWEEKK